MEFQPTKHSSADRLLLLRQLLLLLTPRNDNDEEEQDSDDDYYPFHELISLTRRRRYKTFFSLLSHRNAKIKNDQATSIDRAALLYCIGGDRNSI